MASNEKYFTFKIVSQKIYDIVFDGVSVINTILMSLALTSGISFVLSAYTYIVYSVSSVMTNTMVMKLFTNVVQTFSSNTNVLYSFKETLKSLVGFSSVISIGYSIRETLKAIAAFSGNIALGMTPILAVIIPLSTHDPKLLSAMDGDTLGDLDYTLAP